jgi:hypothetical protein
VNLFDSSDVKTLAKIARELAVGDAERCSTRKFEVSTTGQSTAGELVAVVQSTRLEINFGDHGCAKLAHPPLSCLGGRSAGASLGSNQAGAHTLEDSMEFEHAHPFASWALWMLAWLLVSASVLWPFSWERLKDRYPFMLTVANFPLEAVVMDMPNALPGLFEYFLGHSIYAHRFETDWQWINRWEIGVGPIFRWGFVLGAIGGLINLIRGRDLIINTLAVAAGLFFYYLSTHVGF